MPLRHRRDNLLPALVLRKAIFDFGQRRLRAIEIGLVHDNDVGHIEHHDFLQLQTRAVIRIHHQHGLIDQLAAKRQRFLPGADRLDDDVIEIALR